MTVMETILFVVNEIIGRDFLKAVDAGDTIFVHLFGAYFGLTVSRVLYQKAQNSSDKEGSSYTSDMFSMVNIIIYNLYIISVKTTFTLSQCWCKGDFLRK